MLQVFLLLLAFACIPWMLLAKPYYMYKEHQKTVGAGYTEPLIADTEAGHGSPVGDEEGGEHGEHVTFDALLIYWHID